VRSQIQMNSFDFRRPSRSGSMPVVEQFLLFGRPWVIGLLWFEVTLLRPLVALERVAIERFFAPLFAESHLTLHGSVFWKDYGCSVIELYSR
jgi:hypothetical protein